MVFSFCPWFEGSEILDEPWKWKYSAHFSQVSDDEVMDAHDISNLDHFVYAAKFKPLFPFLMALTASYIIILRVIPYSKEALKKQHYFCLDLGSFF